MRRAAPTLVLLSTIALALTGCSSSGATKEQADQGCANLAAGQIVGTGGVAFAQQDLMKTYNLSAPDASNVMRDAVKSYCPQYQPLM